MDAKKLITVLRFGPCWHSVQTVRQDQVRHNLYWTLRQEEQNNVQIQCSSCSIDWRLGLRSATKGQVQHYDAIIPTYETKFQACTCGEFRSIGQFQLNDMLFPLLMYTLSYEENTSAREVKGVINSQRVGRCILTLILMLLIRVCGSCAVCGST